MRKHKSLELRWQHQVCFFCRYYRMVVQEPSNPCRPSECLLLRRTLSVTSDPKDDRDRVCDAWKRRPKKWDYLVKLNPHWRDPYIPRGQLLNLRKRLGIGKRKLVNTNVERGLK